MRNVLRFLRGCVRLVFTGGKVYKAWMLFLIATIVVGAVGYANQLKHGLIATAMRDQVSWAFYVGNFTFLVGLAAAAVLLVIPAYVYHWKPIKEVVILGELLAISAITMCLLFILVDMGRPDRFWHIIPIIGLTNWPRSLLSWDALVLNMYLALNTVVVAHLLYTAFFRKPYNKSIVVPLVLFSIPAAVSIHTVTAFLYNGMAARPFWNAAILAPKFIASAFCSGPAVMLILFQFLRKATGLDIKDEAIWKVAELMAYAMFLNLFMTGAETFVESYSATEHAIHHELLWHGIEGHDKLVPFAWASLIFSVIAFFLFLIPKTRKNWVTLNIGCVLIYAGVYIEKGMGLVIPGMTPDTLGEIYSYTPTATEWSIAAGIFGIGFMVFTILVKIAAPVMSGTFHVGMLEPARAGAPAVPAHARAEDAAARTAH